MSCTSIDGRSRLGPVDALVNQRGMLKPRERNVNMEEVMSGRLDDDSNQKVDWVLPVTGYRMVQYRTR